MILFLIHKYREVSYKIGDTPSHPRVSILQLSDFGWFGKLYCMRIYDTHIHIYTYMYIYTWRIHKEWICIALLTLTCLHVPALRQERAKKAQGQQRILEEHAGAQGWVHEKLEMVVMKIALEWDSAKMNDIRHRDFTRVGSSQKQIRISFDALILRERVPSRHSARQHVIWTTCMLS